MVRLYPFKAVKPQSANLSRETIKCNGDSWSYSPESNICNADYLNGNAPNPSQVCHFQ